MNTDELKRLAEAATPGPWKSQLSSVKKGSRNIASNIHAGESLPIGEDVKRGQTNAAYIAAANPAVILELIAERDALREILEGVLKFDRGTSGRIIIEGWQEEVIRAALEKKE